MNQFRVVKVPNKTENRQKKRAFSRLPFATRLFAVRGPDGTLNLLCEAYACERARDNSLAGRSVLLNEMKLCDKGASLMFQNERENVVSESDGQYGKVSGSKEMKPGPPTEVWRSLR